ncbi:MAG: response regulator [bacterium]|nr:response regulator [bacterium]
MADKRVLILEDNRELLRLYGKMLTAEGYIVHEADSLAAARDHLELYRFDACLLDFEVGARCGIELLAAAPVLHTSRTRTVVMSVADHHRRLCEMIGLEFHLKPLMRRDLARLVDATAPSTAAIN